MDKTKEQVIMEQMSKERANRTLVQHVLTHQDDYPDLICISCGGMFFDRANKTKRVPSLDPNNPLGVEQAVYIECWVCRGCGTEIFLSGDQCNVIERQPISKTIIPS